MYHKPIYSFTILPKYKALIIDAAITATASLLID